MYILVTGGAGYIGSHVVRHLMEQGYEVVVLDTLETGHREACGQSIFVQGDVGDYGLLRKVMATYSIEGVIHLAGRSLLGESFQKPALYYESNVCRGLNLLKAMVDYGVPYIIFSSTAAVYGEPRSLPITEEHEEAPQSPYGESKLFFERILRRFGAAYGVQSISLRYFNAAGAHPKGDLGEKHDPETHLIPIILETALGKRERVSVFGDDYPTHDGTCVRDYVHVWDLARAHGQALQALKEGRGSAVYNLGSGRGYSVGEVLEMASRVVGHSIPHSIAPRRQGDPAILLAAGNKIEKELGWRPSHGSLQTILETAWNWHKGGGFSGSDYENTNN